MDDADIGAGGERLSAGLIAAGASCQARPLRSGATKTDWLVSPEVGASLSNFQALSNLNSINVHLPSSLTPTLP